MRWKDTTSRSQNNPNAPATCWTGKNDALEITVLNRHRHYPEEWIMHCYALGFDAYRMKIPFETSPEEAQAWAVNIVRNRLMAMLNSLPE